MTAESLTLTLAEGATKEVTFENNVYTVVVTAEDETTKETYTITVTIAEEEEQKSNDVSISEVKVAEVSAEVDTEDATKYTVTVPFGTELTAESLTLTLAEGATKEVTFENNVYTVVVTAEDETTKETYTITVTIAEEVPEEGKATAKVTTTAGDNYDINPLGTVSVKLTYGDNIKTSDIEELTIELFNGENKLATNILQPKKLNEKEKASDYIVSPFNLGRSEEHSEWAWVRGKYNLQGTEVTQADLPNKVVATYKVDGKTYVSEIEITESLTVPAPYELLAPPAGSKTELEIADLKVEDVKFLAFGLNEEEKDVQKVATLEEVKTFIDGKYGVTFNTDAIKVEEGKISISGSILNTADWNKVKANGDKKIPYRITVLNGDKSNKIAKIAMYEDSKAVIEEIE